MQHLRQGSLFYFTRLADNDLRRSHWQIRIGYKWNICTCPAEACAIYAISVSLILDALLPLGRYCKCVRLF